MKKSARDDIGKQAEFAFTPEGIMKNLHKNIVKRPNALKKKQMKDMSAYEKKKMVGSIFKNFFKSKLTG